MISQSSSKNADSHSAEQSASSLLSLAQSPSLSFPYSALSTGKYDSDEFNLRRIKPSDVAHSNSVQESSVPSPPLSSQAMPPTLTLLTPSPLQYPPPSPDSDFTLTRFSVTSSNTPSYTIPTLLSKDLNSDLPHQRPSSHRDTPSQHNPLSSPSIPHPLTMPPSHKRVLILFPTRLALNTIPRSRSKLFMHIFSSPLSCGVAGGHPGSAHFFFGCQDHVMFFLDPHGTRPAEPLEPPELILATETARYATASLAVCPPATNPHTHINSQIRTQQSETPEAGHQILQYSNEHQSSSSSPTNVFTHMTVNVECTDEKPLSAAATFHAQNTSLLHRMSLSSMDPSMCFGFLLSRKEDLAALKLLIHDAAAACSPTGKESTKQLDEDSFTADQFLAFVPGTKRDAFAKKQPSFVGTTSVKIPNDKKSTMDNDFSNTESSDSASDFQILE